MQLNTVHKTLLLLNVCDARRKRQKKPECCNSKEGKRWWERTQKHRPSLGAHNWPCLSSQDHIKVGSVGTYSPYSKWLKENTWNKSLSSLETGAETFQNLSETTQKIQQNQDLCPMLLPNVLSTISHLWAKGKLDQNWTGLSGALKQPFFLTSFWKSFQVPAVHLGD